MLAMLAAGQLLGRVDARVLIGVGLLLAAVSMYLMSLFSPVMDATPFLVTGFLQGAGLGLVFVALNTLAVATLPPDLRTHAAGFYMRLRNLDGSIGIGLTVGVLAYQAQVSRADIGADAVIAMLDGSVNAQVFMVAHVDVFRLMFWVTCTMFPMLLLRRPKAASPAVHLAD